MKPFESYFESTKRQTSINLEFITDTGVVNAARSVLSKSEFSDYVELSKTLIKTNDQLNILLKKVLEKVRT